MNDSEFKLTPSVLKVIAEDTKMKILKELISGPRIPADLSRKLDRSVPTILEHLGILANAGLVERQQQPGRKYVFYALTQSGEELVSNKTRLSVVLYSSIMLFILGISMLAFGYYSRGYSAPMGAMQVSNPNASTSMPSIPSQSLAIFSIIEIAIFVAALILLILYLGKSRHINFIMGS